MLRTTFQPQYWAAVPFHFWSGVFFVFGSIVGSFLNVCIHRMPAGQSIISPPSHCPHCKYAIPWYLNIPLITWLYLRGKCKNCGAPISIRYFLVELVTGIAFLACWLAFGQQSAALVLIYAMFLAGLIVATFIDFEHFIIPDEITLGGMVVGLLCSWLVPGLHHQRSHLGALGASAIGLVFGAGLVYSILRLGKLVFGRQKLKLAQETRIVFGENALQLPDREIAYEEVFYRPSDVIALRARTVELVDRCYKDVLVRLGLSQKPPLLQIGEEKLNPEGVAHLEAVSAEIVLPREAMGLGDVKFMGAIGAFLGWQAVLFSLVISSFIGALVGVGLVVMRKRALSSRLPYGPYIALAATIWMFAGRELVSWYGRFISSIFAH